MSDRRAVLGNLALTLTALAAGVALTLAVALTRPTTQTSAAPNLSVEEQAFVVLINDYREANGLGPLALDWEMQSSSDWMSSDMVARSYFSHTDSLGRIPWTRLCDFEYCYDTWMGENLAVGYSTAINVFNAWKNSPWPQRQHAGPELCGNGHLTRLRLRQSLWLVLDYRLRRSGEQSFRVIGGLLHQDTGAR